VTEPARPATPLSGRRREAARNNERILRAAQEVFTADPGARVSAVARRAGVGISALYTRYASKEGLLRHLCADGLQRLARLADQALADERDHWTVFAEFMQRTVAADISSLTLSLAGKFRPSTELSALAGQANDKIQALFDRVRPVLRADLDVLDLPPIWEQLAAITIGSPGRAAELRNRYLTIMLDGLRAGAAGTLPGTPPTPQEVSGRWYSSP
jgi:AcrR family transcriptional regulator